jgi:hypothetical protein
MLVFFLFLNNPSSNKPELVKKFLSNQQTKEAPTVQQINLNPSINTLSPPEVTSSFSEIKITFPQPVKSSDQKLISVGISPTIRGVYKWSGDGKELIFTPAQPYQDNTEYSLNVLYNGVEIFSQKIKTENTSPTPSQSLMDNQLVADKDYANWSKSIFENYPWINQFPIQNSNYFVYFDTDKIRVIAKLYPKKSSNLTINQQVEQFKTEILQKMKDINQDTLNYPIDWTIIEK